VSMLRNRIARVGQVPPMAVIGTLNGPAQLPDSRLSSTAGMMTYEDTAVLITPDGRPVPALTGGSWGQVYRAGTIS
jgi:hypothetical protein